MRSLVVGICLAWGLAQLGGCAADSWQRPGVSLHAPFAFPGIAVFVEGDSSDLPPLQLRAGHATADSFALPLPPPGRSLTLELRTFQHSRLRQPLAMVAPDALALPGANQVRVGAGRLLDAVPVLDWGRPLQAPSIGCGLYVLSDRAAQFACGTEPDALPHRLDLDQPQAGRTYATVAERLRIPPGIYHFEATSGEVALGGQIEVVAGAYTVLGLRFLSGRP